MSDRHFMAMLQELQAQSRFVCVGLDTDVEKLPDEAFPGRSYTHAILEFNKRIIDATADIAGSFKINVAFYECLGPVGLEILKATIEYIKQVSPGAPIILDAKRADIGNTNLGYVTAAFEELGADAVTVHPYLGREALAPFLEQEDKGIIVLCRTSNEGAGEFQDLAVAVPGYETAERLGINSAIVAYRNGCQHQPQVPLYLYVAHSVAHDWNERSNCCVVAGATYPGELADIRAAVGDMPILIPGIGAQGGDLEATVAAGRDSNNQGMIVNNSRGIIFAFAKSDVFSPAQFDEAAREAAQTMNGQLQLAAEA